MFQLSCGRPGCNRGDGTEEGMESIGSGSRAWREFGMLLQVVGCQKMAHEQKTDAARMELIR